MADSAERFVAEVAALTDNRVSIKLFGAGEIVPAFESMDAVAGGTVDLGHSAPAYWVGKHPAFNYFAGVPFGFTAWEMAAWVHAGGGQSLWEELMADFGIHPLYAGSTGTQAGGWFRREVSKPEDLQGLKLRISGIGGEVLKRMGATPVLIPPGEIAPAMLSGAVDGAEWLGPWHDMAIGLYRAAKYYYMPGLHEPGPTAEIIVNKRVYENLTVDQRTAIRVAAAASAQELFSTYTYQNIVSLGPLLAEHDVQLRRFSHDIVKTMASRTTEVIDELSRSDPLTAKIHNSFAVFLEKCRDYAPNAEGGYLTARSRV